MIVRLVVLLAAATLAIWLIGALTGQVGLVLVVAIAAALYGRRLRRSGG